MRKLTGIMLVALFGVMLISSNAQANQLACSERASILDHLSDTFEESPVAIGMASNGGVLEILSSDEGNTWTILITMPNGTSCLVASGQHWERFPIPVSGPKA